MAKLNSDDLRRVDVAGSTSRVYPSAGVGRVTDLHLAR